MPITKEQIIAAMQSLARKLGHTPTTTEFTRLSGMNDRNASRLFKAYLNAVRAAGTEQERPTPEFSACWRTVRCWVRRHSGQGWRMGR
jgi:hypothetical protein